MQSEEVLEAIECDWCHSDASVKIGTRHLCEDCLPEYYEQIALDAYEERGLCD